ncbi:MAG: septum formation initiator family protein [Desulfatibacillum sp.]|nr:septum formation initiator family protein [Desulfatibacillum sp.]
MNKLHNILIAVLVVIVAVLFFFLAFGNRGLVDMYNLKREVARLAQKNQELEKENTRLRRTMYRLLEDPAYLESVARKELGMVARDEFIYDFKKQSEKAEK